MQSRVDSRFAGNCPLSTVRFLMQRAVGQRTASSSIPNVTADLENWATTANPAEHRAFNTVLRILPKTGRTNYRRCAERRSVLIESLINHTNLVGLQLVEFDSDGGNNKLIVAACLSRRALALGPSPLILGV